MAQTLHELSGNSSCLKGSYSRSSDFRSGDRPVWCPHSGRVMLPTATNNCRLFWPKELKCSGLSWSECLRGYRNRLTRPNLVYFLRFYYCIQSLNYLNYLSYCKPTFNRLTESHLDHLISLLVASMPGNLKLNLVGLQRVDF